MISRQHRFHGLNALDGFYKQAQTVRGQQLALKYRLDNHRQAWRAAVVVSKKVSKSAVKRNRIRRRVYAAIQRQAPGLTKPCDLVFVVHTPELATQPATVVQRAVAELMLKAGTITSVVG